MAREAGSGIAKAPADEDLRPGHARANGQRTEALQGEAVRLLMRELRDSMETTLHVQEGMVQRFVDRLLEQQASAGSLTQESTRDSGATTVAVAASPTTQPPKAEDHADLHGPSNHVGDVVHKLSRQMTFEVYSARMSEGLRKNKHHTDPREVIINRRKNSPSLLARLFWKAYYIYMGFQEPPRNGWLANIVLSAKFEFLALVMIMMNGLVVVYQADRNARLAIEDPDMLKIRESAVHWDYVLEYLFVTFFVVELVLRLLVHRAYFFVNPDWGWNLLDFFTIVFTILDALMTFLSISAAALDANFLRVLRIFKVAKSLRIFRALHFIHNLRRLLECMVSSLWQIIWSCVLIIFITAIFGTVVCQCVTTFFVDVGEAEHEEVDLVALANDFGGVSPAMFTLFKTTSGGGEWALYYKQLSHTGFIAPVVILLYILFFLIAAWNVVTSLFIERALTLAQPDMDKLLLEKRQEEMADAKDLLKLLKDLDKDGNGSIGVEEFMDCMCHPPIQAFFELRNIDIKDAEMFFIMLQACVGNDEVEVEMLVNALMKMRGVAMNLDLQALQFQHKVHNASMERSICEIRDRLGSLASDLRLVSRSTAALAHGATSEDRIYEDCKGIRMRLLDCSESDADEQGYFL